MRTLRGAAQRPARAAHGAGGALAPAPTGQPGPGRGLYPAWAMTSGPLLASDVPASRHGHSDGRRLRADVNDHGVMRVSDAAGEHLFTLDTLGVDLRNKKMLLVSPSRSERRFLGAIEGLELVTLDIRPVLKPDVVADLCNMPEVSSADFDFVYASCVLNCVYDLHAALAEIHRVLKPGGSFLNVEILNPGGRTVERTDESVIMQHYGREDFERYRVGGHRSFGELDYPDILGRHFEYVDRVWVLDLPYDKGQWWHVASRGAEAPDGGPAAADSSESTSSTESSSRRAGSRWWRRSPSTGASSG
jgi:SAM-dependent methyltransferase